MDIERPTALDTLRITEADFRRIYEKKVPSTTYLTHGIHSYTARLIPQIPRYFAERYANEGDIILDPFCGSGTTCLEAKLVGKDSIGIDINPLAVLISKVKTTPLEKSELQNAVKCVMLRVAEKKTFPLVNFPKIDYWFGKEAQLDLSRIRSVIFELEKEIDQTTFNFLLLCFSSIIRKSSLADQGMAKTYRSKRVFEKIKSGWTPKPIQYFKEAIEKNAERIESYSRLIDHNHRQVNIHKGDARNTKAILEANGFKKVDLIITSPPYINAQDYFRSYKLELLWLGMATTDQLIRLNRQAIGTEQPQDSPYTSFPKCENTLLNEILEEIWNGNKKKRRKKAYIIWQYFERMSAVFKELYGAAREGGHLCLVTGNNTICEKTIPTFNLLAQSAEQAGFTLIDTYRDEIINRWLFPDRNHKCGTIKEEWIGLFKK